METIELINSGKICPYCSKETELVPSAEIYGPDMPDFGFLYLCRPCFAYVGCHKGSTEALGRIANTELRQMKKMAHAAFDPIWKHPMFAMTGYTKLEARTGCYLWLSIMMGLDINDTHIGYFDVEQCKTVIHICEKLNPFKFKIPAINPDNIF